MMRRRISFGSGTAFLLLVVVALSMSLLGMLTQMSTRSDIALQRRSAQMSEGVYDLFARAESTTAQLDIYLATCAARAQSEEEYLERVEDGLDARMTMQDGLIRWSEERDGQRLNCAVEIAPWGETERFHWREHRTVLQSGSDWE